MASKTGLPSVASIDTLLPQPRFYELYDVGTGALYGSTLRVAGSGTVVAGVCRDIANVEMCCERLRANSAERVASADVTADLAMYIPPLCSTSKDTPDGDKSIRDLNDAVMAWLMGSDSVGVDDDSDDGHQVLLLHGQSGSGKSLFCVLLEQRLWAAYRRGATTYTPLLVALPTAKDPVKSAVEEPLRECGLSSLADGVEGGSRRWLIILDGFDEVQGNTNFVLSNKLNGVKGVKVGHSTTPPHTTAHFTTPLQYVSVTCA